MTEDEMAGWHHRHNGHGFGWTPGVGDGQGGLACSGSWGRKESDIYIPHSPSPFKPCPKPVLYACISTPVLQRGSSMPFF